jgi:hypothetical protein
MGSRKMVLTTLIADGQGSIICQIAALREEYLFVLQRGK